MTQDLDLSSISKTTGEMTAAAPDSYLAALAVWLEGKPDNTQRSYHRALEQLLGFSGKHPGQITPLDIAGWKEQLKQSGRADATIEQRLSAVSSYYQFLQRPLADGRPLHPNNPVAGMGRSDLSVDPYARARKISAEKFRQILSIIDVAKPNGARDKAAFLFYVEVA